jgi:pimeloyl-ACP methyl ester carboxylesterase
VLDELQRRKLMDDQIGVLGVSYGASMSLLLAAQDKRVATIVALEPFSDAAKAVVEFAHGISPGQAAKISQSTFAAAVTKAAHRGNFSWSTGDVLAAMDHVTAPILFYHGAKDSWLSPENSRRLFAKAPAASRLVILPDDDHLLLSMRLGSIVPEVTEWFGSKLAHPVAASLPVAL